MTVKDFRGGPAGWSLTGKVTDFTGPGGKIDAGKLSWTPACATKAGSPSTCAAGSAGRWAVRARPWPPPPTGRSPAASSPSTPELSLDVPAFTAPGTYSGVLTLTLT